MFDEDTLMPLDPFLLYVYWVKLNELLVPNMKGTCVIIGALCADTGGNRNAVTLGCKEFTGFQI